jgi:hypothetical protein
MKQAFTIDLVAFKPSGKYYAEYSIGGIFSVLDQDPECPFLDEVIDAVQAAKKNGSIPAEFDYLIETGVSHLVKSQEVLKLEADSYPKAAAAFKENPSRDNCLAKIAVLWKDLPKNEIKHLYDSFLTFVNDGASPQEAFDRVCDEYVKRLGGAS